jgi:hypothetical protein
MTTSYSPSEATIEAAIESRVSSAGFFQRVAEQLARSIYAYDFASLVPCGRRPDDKTISGWPDAYLSKADGTFVAIEATTVSQARRNHWRRDLERLQNELPNGHVRGIVWVAWCNPTGPTDAAEMRDEAVNLGILPEDVHIIFRAEACARLREPFHASFWVNDLNLRATSRPFSRVEDVLDRIGARQTAGIFPTTNDFKENNVYSPAILSNIEETLSNFGAAVVIGHGATGKTTLAMSLSYRPAFRSSPSYYLDLSTAAVDPDLEERAAEALTALAAKGVLFILDNAHLAPETAVRVYEQWRDFGRESQFLILTRRTRAKKEAWDREPQIEHIGVPCFDLVVAPADLEGVYQRLHRANRESYPASIPIEILAQWNQLFGGDLLAFSAAILGLFGRNGDVSTLRASDARAYIRSRYLLDPSLAAELSVLLDLAALAEAEGLAPLEIFPEEALKGCVRRGLIWVEERGRNGMYKLYRLIHPGLGTLLREAADCADSSRETRCRLLRAHPFACTSIAMRLAQAGATEEAHALISALWQDVDWPLAELSFRFWGHSIRTAERLGVLTPQEISRRTAAWSALPEARETLLRRTLEEPARNVLSILKFAPTKLPVIYNALREELMDNNNRARLVLSAQQKNPESLTMFLRFCDRSMPEVANVLYEEFQSQPSRAALTANSLKGPLSSTPLFLEFVRTRMPGVFSDICARIALDPTSLVTRALSTPLEHLASFLIFARKSLPEALHAIRIELEKERYRIRLIEKAMVTPLGHLAYFLQFSEAAMPKVTEVIKNGLSAQRYEAQLIVRAVATPLDHLASFLAYARRSLPNLSREIESAILSERFASVISERCVLDGPEKISALCRFDDAFSVILKRVDIDAWSRQWSVAPRGAPLGFKTFSLFCYLSGRQDLASTIAKSIILTSQLIDFPSKGTTIVHQVFILTSAHECTRIEVEEFLNRCFAADWVDSQYKSPLANAGALGGALRRIALDERDWLKPYYCSSALLQRVNDERPTAKCAPRLVAGWLQLLSSARLLDCGVPDLRPADFQPLAASLEIFGPGPPDEAIQGIQAGIWAGLREWCHLTQRQPSVDPKLAKGILAQFRSASADRPRTQALNSVMIDWLERSEVQDWQLVADRIPLLDVWKHRSLHESS